jgi:DNA-binding MarR family transcriptional regulator
MPLADDPREATLMASRALLGVIARSVSEALEDVTLPQFRVMVILTGSGPLRMGSLAKRVGAVTSTFSRSLDRMEKQGWVRREPSPDSRREVQIHLTRRGSDLVASVTERRRREIAEILGRMSADDAHQVARAFALFAAAAGEVPAEDLLVLGV